MLKFLSHMEKWSEFVWHIRLVRPTLLGEATASWQDWFCLQARVHLFHRNTMGPILADQMHYDVVLDRFVGTRQG